MNQTHRTYRIFDSAVVTGITWHCREEEVCDCYRGQSSPKSFLKLSDLLFLLQDIFRQKPAS